MEITQTLYWRNGDKTESEPWLDFPGQRDLVYYFTINRIQFMIIDHRLKIESYAADATVDNPHIPADLNLERNERQLILKALKLSDWHQGRAAELLGVSARCLHYKLSQHNITHPNWPRFKKNGKAQKEKAV